MLSVQLVETQLGPGKGSIPGDSCYQKDHLSKNTTAVSVKEALVRFFACMLLWENDVKNVKSCIIGMCKILLVIGALFAW